MVMDKGGYTDKVHVVLVEPIDSLNIGAVARAMMNFGFGNLHLVSPRNFKIDIARRTACQAAPLLDSIKIHTGLEDVLSPLKEVVGFSAREGRNRTSRVILSDWLTRLKEEVFQDTALLFGPEDTGLRKEHIEHCRWLVRIPSSLENPSFNLAQAVLLVLYELRRLSWSAEQFSEQPEYPTWNEFYQLDRIVDELGEQSEFFREGTPAPVPALVKNLFRRINPNAREMRIVMGFLGRISRTLKRKP